ncbi:family 20 glycosylhydrolase [Pedobacter cryoconitis]|uniref:beta-N-acetylhexosaminidase n=1 Tax=Pedobacter cryoconitis TaxID=188932 RepID=A0A7X0MGR4_9SPHI|nr:family 20 glycosylhydrolase [Pedobacter cryoconitis]MBB6498602.1 hexosaminidase [Pedobacter cryoconitis]
MNKLLTTTILAVILLFNQSNVNAQTITVIPQPTVLKPGTGKFLLSRNTLIINGEKPFFKAAAAELGMMTTKCTATIKNEGKIIFKAGTTALPPGGYELVVSTQSVTITTNTAEGAFSAVSTLKQLIGAPLFKPTSSLTLEIPVVEITDAPRFEWRGIHLDVSRHFFDIAYLKKMIDRMALYKFNKFHLHLTDDQGWRIEIKKYPMLTAKGAWRTLNKQDSVCLEKAKENPDFALPEKHFKVIDGVRKYGGFYTQEEMKDLIRYAQDRSVEIIPEIDMPGHMMAATALMPWLTSNNKGGQAKDFSEPLCPCKETTYEFAENVFTEIAALFPSQYIHLGADEVEKSSWKNVPECDALMKKEGLKDINELQSYFVHRMERFFNSKNKKLIGWDEILDGGVSKTATLMYWRTWIPGAPKKAAEKGNEIIMTPGEYCYFDAQQDNNSLQKVYSFDPFNFHLDEADRKYVKGVQASTWTEYIPSEDRLEYMIFPRIMAMSEIAWRGKGSDWNGFEKKVIQQLPMLDAMKINYRFLDLTGFSLNSVFVDSASLQIINPVEAFKIRYTTDNSLPTNTSALFSGKLKITAPVQIKLAAFNDADKRGEVYTVNYKKLNYLEPATTDALQKGLNFYYYPHSYRSVKEISEKDLLTKQVTQAIEIPVTQTADQFATRHKGYFYAAETGVYTFFLRSDDGSVLNMDGAVLVDNGGLHTSIEKSAQTALKKGYHPFELLFLEGGGGYTLKLEVVDPSGKRRAVNAEDFYK